MVFIVISIIFVAAAVIILIDYKNTQLRLLRKSIKSQGVQQSIKWA